MTASIHPFRSLPASPGEQGIAVPGEVVSSHASSGTVSFCVGRAVVARRSHKPEVAGSNPAPATTLPVSAATMALLKAIAAHERLTVAQLVAELACERAKTIGLSRLARAVLDHPSHTCGAEGRKGVPSGVLPLPQGPP